MRFFKFIISFAVVLVSFLLKPFKKAKLFDEKAKELEDDKSFADEISQDQDDDPDKDQNLERKVQDNVEIINNDVEQKPDFKVVGFAKVFGRWTEAVLKIRKDELGVDSDEELAEIYRYSQKRGKKTIGKHTALLAFLRYVSIDRKNQQNNDPNINNNGRGPGSGGQGR
ncbi:MAG: hypothetical protein AAF195_00425 [Pseudomonadota bacterium]